MERNPRDRLIVALDLPDLRAAESMVAATLARFFTEEPTIHTALMAQAKSCHDELETYYRAAVDFAKVDEAAKECAGLFGLE